MSFCVDNNNSHPAFSPEDYLAAQLRLRFKDYHSRFASPALPDLSMRMRHFYATFLSQQAAERKPARRDKLAVVRTLLELAQEAHEIRALGKEVCFVRCVNACPALGDGWNLNASLGRCWMENECLPCPRGWMDGK